MKNVKFWEKISYCLLFIGILFTEKKELILSKNIKIMKYKQFDSLKVALGLVESKNIEPT